LLVQGNTLILMVNFFSCGYCDVLKRENWNNLWNGWDWERCLCL